MILLFILLSAVKAYENYEESLNVTTYSTGHVLSDFRFVVSRETSDEESKNYLLFPRLLEEIVEKHDVKHLVLTMGQSRWRNEEWGIPPQPAAPSGAQLLVQFSNFNETRTDEALKALIESLNGILCTSLSSIPTIAVAPKISVLSSKYDNGEFSEKFTTRYGTLNREPTCTENLSRLLKLLPCKEVGLAALIHPFKVYDSLFHSTSLSVFSNCGVNKCHYEVEIGVSTMFKSTPTGWRLSDLLERKLPGVCSAATTSNVFVSANKKMMKIAPAGVDIDGEIMKYNVSTDMNAINEIQADFIRVEKIASGSDRSLRIWSSSGGFDQQKGVLHVSLRGSAQSDLRVILSQIVPYFVIIRYNSLKFECSSPTAQNEPYNKVVLPGSHNKGSFFLQFEFSLPQNGQCELTIPFEKKLLRISDYPPDPNYGMIIPGAIANVYDSSCANSTACQKYSVHSNAILVALPVPDFSMPFNVICFVATAATLLYGPLFSHSTMWLAPPKPSKSMFKKLFKVVLLALIAFASYAQYVNISLHEVRRQIVLFWEKLNDLR